MMIKVGTQIGDFIILNGEFIGNNKILKALYNASTVFPINPWEGPIDFAIAARMVGDLPNGFKVVDFDYPNVVKNEPN